MYNLSSQSHFSDRQIRYIDAAIENITRTLTLHRHGSDPSLVVRILLAKMERERLHAHATVAKAMALEADVNILIEGTKLRLELSEFARLETHVDHRRKSSSRSSSRQHRTKPESPQRTNKTSDKPSADQDSNFPSGEPLSTQRTSSRATASPQQVREAEKEMLVAEVALPEPQQSKKKDKNKPKSHKSSSSHKPRSKSSQKDSSKTSKSGSFSQKHLTGEDKISRDISESQMHKSKTCSSLQRIQQSGSLATDKQLRVELQRTDTKSNDNREGVSGLRSSSSTSSRHKPESKSSHNNHGNSKAKSDSSRHKPESKSSHNNHGNSKAKSDSAPGLDKNTNRDPRLKTRRPSIRPVTSVQLNKEPPITATPSITSKRHITAREQLTRYAIEMVDKTEKPKQALRRERRCKSTMDCSGSNNYPLTEEGREQTTMKRKYQEVCPAPAEHISHLNSKRQHVENSQDVGLGLPEKVTDINDVSKQQFVNNIFNEVLKTKQVKREFDSMSLFSAKTLVLSMKSEFMKEDD